MQKDAEREARDLILRQTAPPLGVTVAQIWQAYQEEARGGAKRPSWPQLARTFFPYLDTCPPTRLQSMTAGALSPRDGQRAERTPRSG